jgi:hypothetical protein
MYKDQRFQSKHNYSAACFVELVQMFIIYDNSSV